MLDVVELKQEYAAWVAAKQVKGYGWHANNVWDFLTERFSPEEVNKRSMQALGGLNEALRNTKFAGNG